MVLKIKTKRRRRRNTKKLYRVVATISGGEGVYTYPVYAKNKKEALQKWEEYRRKRRIRRAVSVTVERV